MEQKLLTSWGQVKLVCPCGGNPDLSYDFDIVKRGKQVMYECTNPTCPNSFSADIQLKVIQWLNAYYKKHGTYQGFVLYFQIKQDNMRLRYIGEQKVTDTFSTLLIEITNMTRQPQFKHRDRSAESRNSE